MPLAAPPSVDELRQAAAGCTACPLWARATQTVFGEGRTGARVMLVGEQPGDHEDIEGRPFVGPAGRVLDNALEAAGIEREDAYVPNAVKHFKWRERGKRRIHDKPNRAEIGACRPCLDLQIAAVRPRALVLLGATAAQSLFGPGFRVTRERGRLIESPLAPLVTATVHPSSILRASHQASREAAMRDFVHDLSRVAALLR
jgi:uracil-DNA glycosylase family protein